MVHDHIDDGPYEEGRGRSARKREVKAIADLAKRLVEACVPRNRSLVRELLAERRAEDSQSDSRSLEQLLNKLRTYSNEDPYFDKAIEQFAAAETENADPIENSLSNYSDLNPFDIRKMYFA